MYFMKPLMMATMLVVFLFRAIIMHPVFWANKNRI